MHDLVIRNGTVIDGSGAPRRFADVAVDAGRITAVGEVAGRGRREIDAAGLIVTPGFVDIHTHYDGQATWDPYLTPSCWHGVTTAIMGNCGVGFAPARPDRHDWLIGLMEGVEDIPGTALAAGIQWEWETFPEYLDAIERKSRVIDVAAHAPHGAIRAYVMGERGASNEPASPDDVAEMARIVAEAMRAGAVGFSTSRTAAHRAKDGEPVPGTHADHDELLGIGRAMGEAGHGVFEMASDLVPPEDEFRWMTEFSAETGLPVTYGLVQISGEADKWRDMLARTDRARAAGARVTAQVCCRPLGILMGWQCDIHPFSAKTAYRAIAHLPLDQRVKRLADPAIKAAILAEVVPIAPGLGAVLSTAFARMFRLQGDGGLDYEPPADQSVAALARRAGTSPEEIVYDLMMGDGGKAAIYLPMTNYDDYSLDAVHEMMSHPAAVLSLSDGGAHCGLICDASFPTFMLSYWTRDRIRGARLPLETVIRMQTSDTASLYGLHDRGVLAPGMKADINLIDYDAVDILPPEMVFDLPAEGRRFIQRAKGYRATIVSGVVTFENGEATGEMPGKLVRGPRASPAYTDAA